LTEKGADGEVEYLRRIDGQVKIRAFRIETGEIEATLAEHPAVAEAVVLAREIEMDPVSGGEEAREPDRRLIAYLVPDERRALPVRRLLRIEREGRTAGRGLLPLPDGSVVFHLNRSETEFLYQEIATEGAYLRHGVHLAEGAVVFDVGANIGLFSLWAARRLRRGTFYAFEPIPPVFEVLCLNAELYGLDARLFPVGLAAEAGTAELVYYPHASVLSGRHAEALEERETVRAFLQDEGGGADLPSGRLEELLEERLRGERVVCPLKTVSQVIREEGVERVDLLKVDVEKSELEVLEGVEDGHWPRIRQVVVEVHDVDGRLERVQSLLERQGFQIAVDQDRALARTRLYNVFAVRPGEPAPSEPPPEEAPFLRYSWSSPDRLVDDLRTFLRARLPEPMRPSAFVLLEELPKTPSGKVDRRALAAIPPGRAGLELERRIVEPRDTLELEIARIWEEVLDARPVGVTDSFFELGGHSILAVHLMERIRTRLGADLPLSSLFTRPTVEHLAGLLREQPTLRKSPLVTLAAGDPGLQPLFLVHPAGGSVLAYLDLARRLGGHPVHGFQSPGLEKGETPLDTVEGQAACYLEALRAVQPAGPYALAGWSFGGVVAYEMARRLTEAGEEVSLLAVLDTAPVTAGDAPKLEPYRLLAPTMRQELSLSSDDLAALREMDPQSQIETLVERARTAGHLPPGFGLEEARRTLEVFLANDRAARSYVPQPYPGSLTLFLASERPPGSIEEIVRSWQELAGEVRLELLPGGHEQLMAPPAVEVLAERVKAVLSPPIPTVIA
jgi:FkbM family methyltransferase